MVRCCATCCRRHRAAAQQAHADADVAVGQWPAEGRSKLTSSPNMGLSGPPVASSSCLRNSTSRISCRGEQRGCSDVTSANRCSDVTSANLGIAQARANRTVLTAHGGEQEIAQRRRDAAIVTSCRPRWRPRPVQFAPHAPARCPSRGKNRRRSCPALAAPAGTRHTAPGWDTPAAAVAPSCAESVKPAKHPGLPPSH